MPDGVRTVTLPTSNWLAAPQRPALAPNEVHIWRAALELPETTLERLRAALSPDELGRVARLRFENNRRRFIASQGALRNILGRYLSSEAAGVRFDYGPAGKPALTGDHSVQFNLSHSHEMALYAIANDREVGVDVEFLRPRPMMKQVAQRFFAGPEVSTLLALPEADRLNAFYRCWTRKEAYMKAKGLGLGIPLASFEVSLRPGEPAALKWVRDDPEETVRWSMASLDPGAGYLGAIVVQGSGWNLRFWEWQA